MSWNAMLRWRAPGLLLLLLLLLYFVHLAQSQPQVIVDEAVHVPQIESFMRGSLETQPNLAMIPGYHAVVAAVLSATGLSSIGAMRALSTVFGAAAALAFYFIRRRLGDEDAGWSALLFYVFPLFYPYYFLAYTDIFSLLVVLLAVLSALNSRHVLAAVIMTLSLAVRQNNIVWAAFLAACAAWPAWTTREAPVGARIRAAMTKAIPYLLPALVFLAYWRWNGSIAFSATLTEAHPDLALSGGNIWFTLFLFLVLFPNEAWKGLRSFGSALRAKPWLVMIPIVAAYGVRLRGSGDNYAFLDFFFHNAFIAFVKHGWAKIGFGVLAGLAACSIAYTRFRDPRGLLVYPFSALCLASSVLIENRYSMVPFALWMAFRKDHSPRWMMPVWLGLSMLLAYGVLTARFML